MSELSLKTVSPDMLPAARFASTALHALAREEAAGRRSRRLLQAGQATWRQFRGRMDAVDFLELLLEDAAVTQPFGFDAPLILAGAASVGRLPASRVQGWIDDLAGLDLSMPAGDYILHQARQLDLETRLARSDLQRGIQAHHKVLELPGTGGQLSAYLAGSLDGIYLQDVFTIGWQGWADRMLAGLVAVEHGLTGEAPVLASAGLESVMGSDTRWDYVVGANPDRGLHAYDLPALETVFPGATIVLV